MNTPYSFLFGSLSIFYIVKLVFCWQKIVKTVQSPVRCSVAIKKYTVVRPKTKSEDKPRLDAFLAQELPNVFGESISKSAIRKLIVAGAVYINNSRIRIASKPVFEGAQVDVYIDKEKLGSKNYFEEKSFELKNENIVFEDDDLIIVNKPHGLPTQPTLDKARNNLFNLVKKFLSKRDGQEPYLGLHHRLDRDTSGLVLFTKSKRCNLPVSEMFKKHTIQKTYLAKVGNAENLNENNSTFIVSNYLWRDPRSHSKMAKYTQTKSGGDFAETHFKILDKESGLVEAQPITGRTHQIRVHLSELGFPILGDPLYGKEYANKASRLMLHAWKLEFTHPFTNQPVCYCSKSGCFEG